MGFNIGGMAAAYEGFRQGQDEETARQRSEEDRTYQKGQREYQATQQTRQRDQWQREDARRAADAAAPTTREVTQTVETPYSGPRPDDQYPDQEMPAVTSQVKKTVAIPMEEQLRGMAERAKSAGAQDDWFKITQEADKLEGKRMSAKLQDAAAAAQGKDPFEAATILSNVFSPAAGTSLHMVNPRKNADGTVTIDVYSRESGSTTPRTYKSADELVKGAMALADPEKYAAIMDAARKAEIERAKERAKGHVVGPGGMFLPGEGDSRRQFVNPTDRIPNAWDDQGNVIGWGKPPTAGAGAGSGKGTKGASGDVAADAMALLAAAAEKSEDKLNIEQRGIAQENVGRLAANNPNMPAAMVARVATELARDPSKATPAINKDTGLIDLVFNDGVNGPVKVHVGIGDAIDQKNLMVVMARQMAAANGGKQPDEKEVKSAVGDALRRAVPQLLASFPPEDAQAYRRAAFNPKERAALNQDLRRQADAAIFQASSSQGATEQQRAVITQRVNASYEQRLKVVDRVLDAVHAYGPQPEKTEDKDAVKEAPTKTQLETAKKFGYNGQGGSNTDLISGAIKTAVGGMKSAAQAMTTPSDAFIKSTLQKIQATNRIEEGDAVALAKAFMAKPQMKKLFTEEQLGAISTISGRKF